MAADIYKTIRNCTTCVKNRVNLRKRTHLLRIFPAARPLAIDILGSLTKTKKDHRFLLVMLDRFSELTHVVSLRRIDVYTAAVAFAEAWGFKYGSPKTLISDNGKQFAAKFFRAVCSLLGISNTFTSTYHPQTKTMSTNIRTTGTDMRRHSRIRTTVTCTVRPTRHRSTLCCLALRPNSRCITLSNYVDHRPRNKRTTTQEDWTMCSKRPTPDS